MLRQRSGFLNRRSSSEIEQAIGSWGQVLGGEIERFQVATLTGIILERRIFAPGMKLGHGDSLVSAIECNFPIRGEVDYFCARSCRRLGFLNLSRGIREKDQS